MCASPRPRVRSPCFFKQNQFVCDPDRFIAQVLSKPIEPAHKPGVVITAAILVGPCGVGVWRYLRKRRE